MPDRTSPYNAFNFRVDFGSGNIQGGFSEVSGLGTEITVAEYRNGNDVRNVVTKIPGMFKVSDVTLKRGVVNSAAVFEMFDALQNGNVAEAKQTVTVTLMDETGANAVQRWVLLDVFPMKYTGPSLSAKGGGDVAMEELQLSVGDIQYDQVA
ncbi:MAG: phage tail protein [Geminicoccaceae bacterium]|nr:MAG: phage tail protein [Geminicoccaceae bacterium]